MKLLQNIGFILTLLGFCAALVNLHLEKDIVKLDILYFFFMFLGCVFQFFPQYKKLKSSKEFNVQSIKYFFGIILGIFCFFGILLWLLKEFYFS
ncbi:MAG: hypothetical protein PUK78_02080 [Spirochaetales bacterium]|nr:hypothetical protein [Spirochaetales bacterium]